MTDGLTLAEMVSAIKENSERLSDWERRFVGDISGKLRAGWNLSEKQIDKLKDIYENCVE